MAGTNDFAFLFRGGANNQILPFNLNALSTDVVIDTKPYLAKAKNRQLVTVSTGTDGELQPNVDALMKLIMDKTGGKLDTIGAFCLVGSSNGCSLVLALAAELKTKGAPQLSYVGVTDVTIMPAGRDPEVPNIGKLLPTRPPELTGLKAKLAIPFADHPHILGNPPEVKLDSPIDAKIKRNFFQKNGNRAKYIRDRPRGLGRGWWWFSNMFAGEVHGKVEGFDDGGGKEFSATGATDDKLHEDICENQPFKDMLNEASQALANFPP